MASNGNSMLVDTPPPTDPNSKTPSGFRPTKPVFRTGERVFLHRPGARALEGPYLVETVVTSNPPTYTLCLENGNPANDGSEVAQADLRL
ncbi:hypothetical protein VTL71DRAFT_2057 [Oculimacula yallundae]|uniref:Uncharacterized protein n=1 Tax=Oculimacula yallundae TaxID=86028 RepID=A0ABR4C9P5_9HELO